MSNVSVMIKDVVDRSDLTQRYEAFEKSKEGPVKSYFKKNKNVFHKKEFSRNDSILSSYTGKEEPLISQRVVIKGLNEGQPIVKSFKPTKTQKQLPSFLHGHNSKDTNDGEFYRKVRDEIKKQVKLKNFKRTENSIKQVVDPDSEMTDRLLDKQYGTG